MRKLFMAMVLTFSFPGAVYAGTIKVAVNGMVCAFCATGIEKSFKAQPKVTDVKVDLDNKLVTIQTKKNDTLSDADIKKIITDAGYAVQSIDRGKGHATAQ